MKGIGNRIRRVRRLLRLTQMEFVEPLSLTQAGLSIIEQGGGVSSETISEISKKWKVNLEWLIHGKGKPFTDDTSDSKEILSEDLSFHFYTSAGTIKRIAGYLMNDRPSEKMIREFGKTLKDEANKLIKLKLEIDDRAKKKKRKKVN